MSCDTVGMTNSIGITVADVDHVRLKSQESKVVCILKEVIVKLFKECSHVMIVQIIHWILILQKKDGFLS